MDFGLGLILSFTDNATAGINNAVNSLNQLTQVADNASASLNEMASLSALSVVSDRIGGAFLSAGTGILGVFSTLIGRTQQVGSEFENFRVTLDALYQDEEKAEQAISRLLDFSVESPFEVDQVKDMLIVLQSQGIDAFSEIQGGISGTRQETLSWIADLMSFKPDEATSRWKRALTNYIGSGEDRMLRNLLDMGDIDQILGHDIGETVEDRVNDIVEIVEGKNLTGLAQNLATTWQGVQSNVSDAFTKIYKSIADNGVFENLKESFMGVTGAILSLDNEQLMSLGATIADGLNLIVSPITKIASKVNELIMSLVNLCQTNPELVKWGMVLGAIIGIVLVAIGIFFKITSALSGFSLMLLASGNTFKTIGGVFAGGLKKMLKTILPFTAVIGLLALAWKSDFAGIKTNVTNFVKNLTNSFKTAKQAVGGDVGELSKTLTNLRSKGDFFSNITIGMMKVMQVGEALADAWGDYTLSEENYLKAKELGILPLIEAILDLKYRFGFFKEGFIEGWTEINNKVKEFFEGLTSSVEGTVLEDMLNSLTTFFDKLTDNDPESWREFGKIVGELSAKFLIIGTAIKIFSSVAGKVSKITGIFSTLLNVIKSIPGAIWGILDTINTSLYVWLDDFIILPIKSLLPKIGSALAGVFGSLSAPVIAIITAVVSSIVAYAVTHWEEFKEKLISIWTTVKEEASAIWESFKEGLKRIWDNLKNSVQPVVDSFLRLKDKCVELFRVLSKNETVQEFIQILSSVGETIVKTVVPAVKGIVRIISTVVQGLWNFLVTCFNSIVNVISSVLTGVMNVIRSVIDIIIGIFTGDLTKIGQAVTNIFVSIFVTVSSVLSSVWNVVASILTYIGNVFMSILSGIVNTVSGAFEGIASFIGSCLNRILGIASRIWNKIKSVIDNVVGNLSSSVQDKWDSIKTGITNAIDGAKDAVKNAIDKIKSFFDFDWKLPDLKLPHLTITGGFSISPPEVPKFSIDWYAKGGVFDKPSVIGVGEAGQEAVMPLENNTGWIGLLASELMSYADNDSNLMPTNSDSQITTNQGDTNNTKYLTSNNSSTTYEGDTDNSVIIHPNAIQVIVQNASEEEATRLAKKILEYIKRQKELDRMTSYAH